MSLSRLCTAGTNYLPPKKGPTPPPLPPSPTSKQACSPNEACGTTCSCPATAPHCASPRGQTVGQCQAGVFGGPAPQKRARRFPSRLIPAGKASLILANYCNKPVWPALVRAAGLCVGAWLGGCSRGRPGQRGEVGLPGQHLLVKSLLLQGKTASLLSARASYPTCRTASGPLLAWHPLAPKRKASAPVCPCPHLC